MLYAQKLVKIFYYNLKFLKNLTNFYFKGITNHEEYGLVREENEQQNENLPDNKSGFSTLTLKRKTIEKERDSKMESLRKKLKTDDESKDFIKKIYLTNFI